MLSDRHSTADLAPIPSLLLTGAVHHHLVREKTRTQVGLLIEAGDVREVHHVALLVGYGAAAINPYLAMESVEDLAREGYYVKVDQETAVANLIKGLGKGVLKVMSKIGVSTVASYTGAQIFECIGLSQAVVDKYFTGTTSKLGGVELDTIAEEVARRHATAYPRGGIAPAHRELEIGGEYQWRREGEPHLFNPETVFRLQHATRTGRYDIFKQYTQAVDDQSEKLMTLRGLFRFKDPSDLGRAPISIDEVEPVSEIVKRFSTGAMSYGSISREAHETLAIAMNRLGAKSNTGEGGEDPDRLYDPERRSSIKQVASGRFGVTSEYLTNSDDIQIKMAQGAKPGEGGQLPGNKVYPWVAKTRHSTPGVGLISPPPHHDIYSIEDLAQLIHDLKNANPGARVHVKLVSEVGVGTVAAGVSKAHADVVLISGHDGGTGASPLTSLKHAGGPWELGLAETQQTLLLNGLRDRIVVQTDGQLKTGRDVVVAALLGAEEFGFATAPLVVSGCILMRVCHLDTCPVGVATQNPVLRARYTGKAEHVVNFFEFIAEEVRELLASLGFRTIDEAIGQVQALDTVDAQRHWKASGLDLSPILHKVHVADTHFPDQDVRNTGTQDHGLEKSLDVTELLPIAAAAIESGEPVRAQLAIRNVNRTVGTILGHEVTKKYGGDGLPDDTIDITFVGSAGQSFGAFVPRGITLRLEGDANDYVGKGLSGGRIAIRPDRSAPFKADEHIIAGNTIAYGATSGEILIRGGVGERCCVRNSGATVVTEGVGDHGCEYMTGGKVAVLGKIGRNFAAGMSGGVAWVLDLKEFRVNRELVELGPVAEVHEDVLHGMVKRHFEETGSEVAEELLADWPTALTRFTEVMPRDFRIVLEAKAKAEADGLDEDGVANAMMESSAWLTPEREHVCSKARPRGRRAASGRGAGQRLAGGLPRRGGPRAAADHRRAGRALHGLRHPVLPPGLPAGQHHPGVERPGLAQRLAGRDRAAARDQQLPGVHRSPVPRSVRDGLRARHQPAGGDDQERRGLDHRQGVGVGLRLPAAARVVVGQDRRRRRVRPGGPRGRAAADPRRPHRRRLRARRQAGRAAPLRHPRVQDGEAAPRPPARADEARGHRVPLRRRGRRRRPDGPRAQGPVRRRGARDRRDRAARPAGARP